MDFLWALIALALGFLMYPAWQILRSFGRLSRAPMIPVSQTDDRYVHGAGGTQTRTLRWVSMDEFREILDLAADLVVIDLRPQDERGSLPVSGTQILCVGPEELAEVLQWLPPDRSAAFCGASGLAVFMIRTSCCMHGSAPLYVVKPQSARREVA